MIFRGKVKASPRKTGRRCPRKRVLFRSPSKCYYKKCEKKYLTDRPKRDVPGTGAYFEVASWIAAASPAPDWEASFWRTCWTSMLVPGAAVATMAKMDCQEKECTEGKGDDQTSSNTLVGGERSDTCSVVNDRCFERKEIGREVRLQRQCARTSISV
jgi:hypothetical protein